jgi:hypothetical protein
VGIATGYATLARMGFEGRGDYAAVADQPDRLGLSLAPSSAGAALAFVHRLDAGDRDGVSFLDEVGA